MSSIDVERALSPVPGDDPTGENLSSDFALFNLLELAKGTPERSIGDIVQPATEPAWDQVRDGAMDLLGRSKDLWLAMLVALAGLRLDGLDGFGDGLLLVRGLLGRYWEGVHPRLDPDDQDASERLSSLSSLSAPGGTYGDDWRFVERIRLAPLTNSRQMGRFSLRDIALATGEISPRGEEEVPSLELIEAAFEDTSTEDLQALSTHTAGAVESLDAIQRSLTEGLGAERSPDFASVRSALRDVQRTLQDQLAKRGYDVDGGADVGMESPDTGGGGVRPGEIRTPQDVKRELDRIINYYMSHEPSSPVPLLLRRAQRLVSRSFMDIIRDLSPDAIEKIQEISGERDDRAEE